MLETKEQIALTLEYCGEPLEFNNGTIKGIPGETLYNVQSFDSPYDVDKQDFDFQVSYDDFFGLGLSSGDTFNYSLNNKIYRFRVMMYSDDLTGWLDLRVTLADVR